MSEPAQKDWMIKGFDEQTKNKLLGYCKAEGIDWKALLKNLIKEYLMKRTKQS